jgi:hypothetical protein
VSAVLNGAKVVRELAGRLTSTTHAGEPKSTEERDETPVWIRRSDGRRSLCAQLERSVPMKRVAISAAVVALLLSAGTAIAAGGGATVETIPMTFAPLNSDTCPYLPDGTSITWSGTGTSITRTMTDANGVTTIGNTTVAHGFATDQDGNTYAFHYGNTFRISNTVANPTVFSGLMTDSFSLAGQGPAMLNNGFVAVFTTDFVSFGFEPLTSRGDPISFNPFPLGYTPHCDPL